VVAQEVQVVQDAAEAAAVVRSEIVERVAEEHLWSPTFGVFPVGGLLP